MKKLFITAVVSILLASCGSRSDKVTKSIEREFRQYVVQNFDNPKSIKEIVDISIIETICARKFFSDSLIETADTLLTSYAKLKRLRTDQHISRATSRNINRVRHSDRMRMANNMTEGISISTRIIGLRNVHNLLKDELIAKAEGMEKEPPIYIYQIRFRQSVNNDIRLQTYYASYTKADKKITILKNLDESLGKYNGSEVYYELAKAYFKFGYNLASLAALYEMWFELYNQIENIWLLSGVQ